MLLEQKRRLSQSRIWQWQRRYYTSEGAAAWQRGTVPHYVTSNAFIAAAYAQVVLGFLRDVPRQPGAAADATQPLYIVELGAGVGRFAYHFVTQLAPLLARAPFAVPPIRYVLTDLAEANVQYYRSHPRLQPLFDAGLLDCARFDVEADTELQLRHSGVTLSPGSLKQPLLCIANYVFDSVPQDAFFVENGRLHESLLWLQVDTPVLDLDDPALLSRVEIEIEHLPVSGPYYSDETWERILQSYVRPGERGELVFPCAALLCLSRLRALASCGLLLLSADKGAYAADDVLSPMPGWSVHGSCSLSVNYHAIAEWTRAQGGQCMHRQSRESGLSLNAFAFGLPELGETRLAFDAHLSSGGPGDLFLLKKFLENHYDSLSLEQTLSLLRLAAFDGQIFAGCVGNLRRQISAGGLSAGLRTDLTAALQKVRELYFPIGEARALEPEIAQLLGLLQAASG